MSDPNQAFTIITLLPPLCPTLIPLYCPSGANAGPAGAGQQA